MKVEIKTYENCSSSDIQTAPVKVLTVEFLYLDLETCQRCLGTEQVLDEVMESLTPVLQMAGFDIVYNKIKVDSQEMAEYYQFSSSPTIRINEKDICQVLTETSCGCCSDISGTEVECRVFNFEGEVFEVPTRAVLTRAILKSLFSNPSQAIEKTQDYVVPLNLNLFFEGKQRKSSCSCEDICC